VSVEENDFANEL